MQTATILVQTLDTEAVDGDVLILPTVADRFEQSRFNKDLYERAGQTVREQLQKELPLRIGNVAVTTGGQLPIDRIVHVPVQTAPDVPTTEENLQVGLRSGLVTADENGTETVLLAKILPPDQELDAVSVAETLQQDLTQYPPAHFEEVILLSNDGHWTRTLRTQF